MPRLILAQIGHVELRNIRNSRSQIGHVNLKSEKRQKAESDEKRRKAPAVSSPIFSSEADFPVRESHDLVWLWVWVRGDVTVDHRSPRNSSHTV